MDSERARKLVQKYIDGTCSPQEKAIVEGWYSQQAGLRPENPEKIDMHLLEESLYHRLPQPSIVRKFNPKWIAAAASLLLILGAGGYFLLVPKNEATQSALVLKEDFAPGGNKAVLTLTNGKRIELSNARTGLVVGDNSIKYDDGSSLSASGASIPEREKHVMLTASTPKGGTYQVTLPDGTHVWLNSSSEVKFPARFKGDSREVEISGEVYFEVAHNAAKPFRVKSAGQTVEVLGTHFNINAYHDEGNVRTTLLEGSVAVLAGGKRSLIKPGQQAQLKGTNISIANVEVTEEVAWKDGYFDFTDADIQTVMRQIARWYNVEVEFKGPVTNETFTGRISRFRNISQVLKIVRSSRSVHLTFEGRRIMVEQ